MENSFLLYQLILLISFVIEAAEVPTRKKLPLFKVDDYNGVVDDIFTSSRISEYSGAQKVQNKRHQSSLHLSYLLGLRGYRGLLLCPLHRV